MAAALPLQGQRPSAPPGLRDTATHAPPTSGTYAYNSFKPGTTAFPKLGQTYVDPVFGTTIRRITDSFPKNAESPIYAKNGWWNADGSRFTHSISGQMVAINPTTGAVVADLPKGSMPNENSFDAVDPNAWYYYNGASIRRFDISTGVDTLVKTFPATLQSLGGSVDWMNRTGRYWLVTYSGATHVWDKATDTIYSGAITADYGNGWIGITPDGTYIVKVVGHNFYSYPINTATRTVSTAGTMFWSLCGDHGDLVSASNGKNYLISSECYNIAAIYRIDIAIPQTTSNITKQQTDNVMLWKNGDWKSGAGHYSCASKVGANQDWCYISMESDDDTFTSMGTWVPGRQEILMVQVVAPYTVRRLAHHRSRQLNCPTCTYGGYAHQPRVSASWDGLKAAWASNYDYDASPGEYSDIYETEVPQLVSSLPGSDTSATPLKSLMFTFTGAFSAWRLIDVLAG